MTTVTGGRVAASVLASLFLVVSAGCVEDTSSIADADSDSDSDVDADVDADTDSDSDTDTDTRQPCPEDSTRLACSVDDDCDNGWFCELGCCHKICLCTTDDDCEACGYGDGFVCVLGQCQAIVPPECTSDEDCGPCQDCIAGRCWGESHTCCLRVCRVEIIESAAHTRTGWTRQFRARAFDEEGRVVPQQRFRWISSDPSVASIGETTGVATGGEFSGQTDITAELLCEEGVDW